MAAQDARLQPDAPIWNGLITLAGRAGQLQRAFQVLEDMQASNCKPNARTFAALIDACSRAENTEMGLRVYQVRNHPRLRPLRLLQTHSDLISVLAVTCT